MAAEEATVRTCARPPPEVSPPLQSSRHRPRVLPAVSLTSVRWAYRLLRGPGVSDGRAGVFARDLRRCSSRGGLSRTCHTQRRWRASTGMALRPGTRRHDSGSALLLHTCPVAGEHNRRTSVVPGGCARSGRRARDQRQRRTRVPHVQRPERHASGPRQVARRGAIRRRGAASRRRLRCALKWRSHSRARRSTRTTPTATSADASANRRSSRSPPDSAETAVAMSGCRKMKKLTTDESV